MKPSAANLMRIGALAVVAIGLAGAGPGGCGMVDPTLPCEQLDENACVANAQCQAEYAGCACAAIACQDGSACPPCSCPDKTTFVACHDVKPTPVCPAIACAARCEHGLAVDQNGCQVCACAPVFCATDTECPVGERCLFAPRDSSQGVCGTIDQTICGSDADCPAGGQCVYPSTGCGADPASGVQCVQAAGRCEPKPVCKSDADCGFGNFCDLATGSCRQYQRCSSDLECGPGMTCQAEPTPPCTDGMCPKMPTYLVCLPTCDTLGEAACNARPDCLAVYGQRCGTPPIDPSLNAFLFCQKREVCPALMCDVYCEFGTVKDANGCDTCQCLPPVQGNCTSDADCGANQHCEFNAVPTGNSMACCNGYTAPACVTCSGICAPNPNPCSSDAECPAGTTCQPDPNDPCNRPDSGIYCYVQPQICLPALPPPPPTPIDCTADSQCKAGERCQYWTGACMPGETCPPAHGVCAPVVCTSDADCDAGTACLPDPNDPCNDPTKGIACFAPGRLVCEPFSGCAGLSELACQSRQACTAVYKPCPPNADCSMLFAGCQ